MNTIVIRSKVFHSYFEDNTFLSNACNQSLHYMKLYRETGQVAFYRFIVETDDKSSHPILYFANKQHDGPFSILIGLPLYQKKERTIGAILNFDVSVIDGAFDTYVDIVTEKECGEINQEVIDDFGDDLTKWPERLKAKLFEKALSVICIFARVQITGLKTSRKIQKLSKRTAADAMKTKPGDGVSKSSVIRLDGKMTLTIDNAADTCDTREFVRHCEAWMVRGHYRHYKSGKVIYINPYKKGSGRLNDKVYKT